MGEAGEIRVHQARAATPVPLVDFLAGMSGVASGRGRLGYRGPRNALAGVGGGLG